MAYRDPSIRQVSRDSRGWLHNACGPGRGSRRSGARRLQRRRGRLGLVLSGSFAENLTDFFRDVL